MYTFMINIPRSCGVVGFPSLNFMFEHLIHEETTRSRVVFFVYECCMQDYRAALVEIAEADARIRECTYFSKCNWRCEEHCLSPCSKISGSKCFSFGWNTVEV